MQPYELRARWVLIPHVKRTEPMDKQAFIAAHLERLGGQKVELKPYLGQRDWMAHTSSRPPEYSSQSYPVAPNGMVLCAIEVNVRGIVFRVLGPSADYTASTDPYAEFCFLPMLTQEEETILWIGRQFEHATVCDNEGRILL